MIYDYVIVGSGPTGLSLSYTLSKNDFNVCLVEKYDKLGGSWNSEWIDNKYFTENAPRVLSGEGPHMDFLYEIGMDENDFHEIYGSILETNIKIFNFVKRYFSLTDYFIFVGESLFYKLRPNNLLLQEWMDHSNLSIKAKECLRIISVTICDTPENTNHHDFFGEISYVNLTQMKNPNKWLNILQKYFKSSNNITIYKNTLVKGLSDTNNKVNNVVCISDGNVININTKNVVLCTQSDAIYPILKNSTISIQNNWYPLSEMKKWSENTYYNGFGFQLHFKQDVKYPEEWCWACVTEWNIIILPVSDWLSLYSKDKDIKTVWSCCIVDMETKSKRIKKTPNECNENEIINEILYQLMNLNTRIPKPDVVTISPNLKKIDGKWKSNNTGFTRKYFDYLPIEGNISGLYALGCFTDPGYDTIAYMKTAVESVKIFLNKYHNIKGFHNKNNKKNDIYYLILLLIILVCIKLI